ncbi:hypothetical protein LTR12_006142 [Friedmanniomyces endolithicus]|nr:hypothetical protein LTR12_006142 [Friedmanniomyces endolithicus]
MTDNAELQAKIAAVTGKIKQHKHHPFFQPTPPPRAYHDQPHSAQPYRGDSRWSPYGRGGRGGFQTAHKNRTLVLSGSSATPTPVRGPPVVATASPPLVSARSTNHQLMTKDTYEREQKQRIEHEGQQRVAKRLKRNTQDQHRILSHLSSTGATSSREIAIGGIRFRLAEDGSKLTRVHGTCPYGSQCRFAHDPDKVAICKDFLRTGTCALGSNCDMSHEMTYHRVSACQYFLRGNCTKTACRYPHLFVSPAAPVCRAFATLGFCAKGPDCDKRHVLECPDHANHGFCADHAKGKCSLPHPERASIIRKAAKRQSKTGSDAESDVSNDAEDKIDEMDDIDSDDEDAVMTGFGDNLHELSQQNDFVGFT